MVKKADSQLIKLYNETRLLNLIRDHGPISRIELAKRSRISKVAVSEIINRLDEAGFIVEVGKGESSVKGGKRPTLIRLKPDGKFVVGVEIRRNDCKVAIANLESEIVAMRQHPHRVNAPAKSVINRIFKDIDEMIKTLQLDPEDMHGIGIALPGFIDYENGMVRFADTLKGWGNLPIAGQFAERYGVPVLLENDVKTRTFGESVLGVGRRIDNLIYIWIGAGIGAGIVLNRQLYRGNMGRAGEIGYLEISNVLNISKRNLPYLYSGQRYLGDILSESAFLEGMNSATAQLNGNGSHAPFTLARFCKAYEAGDPAARAIAEEYAQVMAGLCMQLIKTIDPKIIILNGRLVETAECLVTRINEIIDEKTLEIPFEFDGVMVGELREEAGIKGAVVMALQSVFRLPVSPVRGHESHV